MTRIAYVNGQYVPQSAATVHIEDRGYQFADGVYEVCIVVNGRYWDMEGHLARLQRSLNELQMAAPMDIEALKVVMGEVVRRNRLKNALVYMQVTRGVAPRSKSGGSSSTTASENLRAGACVSRLPRTACNRRCCSERWYCAKRQTSRPIDATKLMTAMTIQTRM